jgi:hypothetical protein
MLNWKLIKNPINWLVVFLMLVIAGIGGHLFLMLLGIESSTPGDEESE